MRYGALQRLLPRPLHRYVLDFEARIEDAVARFSSRFSDDAPVLDAGAGESRHAPAFPRQRYVAVDLAVGDVCWNYSALDAVADLASLPFRDGTFAGALNVVTLEHVPNPQEVVTELVRVLAPGGRLLVIVPCSWELHQTPHDYYRYTRHGMSHLLARAGCRDIRIEAMGGYFRLLARRLLNGVQFFPPPLMPLALLFVAPAALLLPLLDGLDRDKIFTLGYVCTAQKPS